jgi:hypothetical protein
MAGYIMLRHYTEWGTGYKRVRNKDFMAFIKVRAWMKGHNCGIYFWGKSLPFSITDTVKIKYRVGWSITLQEHLVIDIRNTFKGSWQT